MLRLLLKLRDAVVVICDHDTETAGLLNRNLHGRDRHIRIVRLVVLQHHLIVHLVNMISGQNQDIFRIVVLHIFKILINRIRRTCVPVASLALLIRRKHGYASDIAIQIPRDTDTDMRI